MSPTYILALDGQANILWVNTLHPSIAMSDLLGKPVWNGAMQEAKMRAMFARCMAGETVRESVLHNVADDFVVYRVEWYPVWLGPVRVVIMSRQINDKLGRLTQRQMDVLRCVHAEMSTGQIANELGMTPATVTKHKQRMRKIFRLGHRVPLNGIAAQLFGPL